MPQPVLVFSRSSERSTKLSSVKCVMLRCASLKSPNALSLPEKLAQLQRRRPAAASVVEQLVDDLLR